MKEYETLRHKLSGIHIESVVYRQLITIVMKTFIRARADMTENHKYDGYIFQSGEFFEYMGDMWKDLDA